MSGSTGNSFPGDGRRAAGGILMYLQSDLVAAALYFARLGTIFSCLAFLFSPFFSFASSADLDVWYRRALLAGAASWVLRLHQRLKTVNMGFTRVLRETLITEDAFHYLVYCIAFALLTPISVSLMPLFLYSLLHVARYTQCLLDASAPLGNAATGDGPDVNVYSNRPSYLRRLLQSALNKVNSNNEPILRWIALNEIMLMVVCIFMAISGPRVIILPFVYYPFLKLRYASRRNPYSKIAFAELRASLQTLACHPRCPTFLSRMIYGLINVVCRLSPTVQ